MMKRILVVGKNGYVATAFRKYISQYEGYQVETVSSRNDEWKKTDFSKFDIVFNASGLSHANARKGTEEQYYEVNGRLPVRIAEKAKKESVKHYISMSSSIVYGDMSMLNQKKNITCDTVPEAPTVYGKSKLMAEHGLEKLRDKEFSIAIIRPPLIYGEDALDNFPRLVNFAMHSPVFPDIYNEQSMIYIDNICELLKLIIDNKSDGIFYPQQKEFIHTSQMVKDIARFAGHKIWLTKVFNPILILLQSHVHFIHKALGSITYDKSMSGHFGWKYCKVSYEDSLKKIVKAKKR